MSIRQSTTGAAGAADTAGAPAPTTPTVTAATATTPTRNRFIFVMGDEDAEPQNKMSRVFTGMRREAPAFRRGEGQPPRGASRVALVGPTPVQLLQPCRVGTVTGQRLICWQGDCGR